jgi:hypothetical protein
MGTRKSNTGAEPAVTCNICGQVPSPGCDWRQGRCPHVPSLLDLIMSNPHKTRFYNLIKFITGKK